MSIRSPFFVAGLAAAAVVVSARQPALKSGLGWAQGWRAKAREEYLRRQVLADSHAWSEFRAHGPLGNIPGFYEAFDVKPGDKLYREPEKRVKIW